MGTSIYLHSNIVRHKSGTRTDLRNERIGYLWKTRQDIKKVKMNTKHENTSETFSRQHDNLIVYPGMVAAWYLRRVSSFGVALLSFGFSWVSLTFWIAVTSTRINHLLKTMSVGQQGGKSFGNVKTSEAKSQ